jgi:serine/threonine protein kinase
LQKGRLTVIGQVSFGGLSAVYLCKDNLGETVILKEAVVPLNADSTSKEKALEMFKREAKILQTLSHPNIARVLDHFVENGRDYLVLEHINGLDLRAYIKEHGPQPERLIMRWALEIADILHYLHNQNPAIIHRDVTPDNLVLDRTGSIKLIDFGAANEFIATATGTLVGKQSYIAPEQFRGKAVPRSDIYALGCTLYYLASGNDPEALSQSSLPADLAHKMPALNKLISDSTAMEMENRLVSMAAVAQEAREYLCTIQQGL